MTQAWRRPWVVKSLEASLCEFHSAVTFEEAVLKAVPGGLKPTYLKDRGHTVINPKLDDDNFDAALATAQAEFDKHHPQVVVGSSRGGAVAMNINSGNAKLVLLCPAWKNWGSAKTVKPGTVRTEKDLVSDSGGRANRGLHLVEPTMSEPEYIDPKKLRPGPIRHESLPPELLERIKAVFDQIGPYLGTTLEQFEIGFMRDMHPASEVALWCSITAAWLAYHEKFLGDKTLPDAEEKKLLSTLIVISTGVEDVSKLNVPVEVGRRLLQCYDELGKE